MDKMTLAAMVLFFVGVAMVALAVPNLGTEVVAEETVVTNSTRSVYGPYDLSRGSYTVWVQDFREEDEFDMWNSLLLTDDNDAYVGDWPNEVRSQTFEDMESELVGIMGNVPEGRYYLIMESEEYTGESAQAFLVKSPGTLEGFFVVTGLTLVIVAFIVFLIARKGPGEVSHG
jgi:hypothetical protein